MPKHRPIKVVIPHERYDPSHPLLRELVLIHVDANDATSFDQLLTRVPSIGEEISREDRSYKVRRVWHEPVDDDGRARFGWHAFVDAELQPEDDFVPRPRPKRPKRKRRRSPPSHRRRPPDTPPA